MNIVTTIVIGANDGPDHHHRSASRANETRKHHADQRRQHEGQQVEQHSAQHRAARPPGATDEWRGLLQDTDIQIRVSHAREPRVIEAQRVLLHALVDAVDVQLLGSDE